jgi:hypothetical protein
MNFAFILVLVAAQAGTPAPSIFGNWALNTAKSRFGGGAERRKSETMTCGMSDVTHCSVISERANGRTLRMRFRGKTDGTLGEVTGADSVDQVILKRVDENTTDATFLFEGKAVNAYRAVRSADKKTLTMTAVDPKTRAPLKSLIVYDAARGVR